MKEIQLLIEKKDGVNAVNARDLWNNLEVKTEFSHWFKRRSSESLAKEDSDFS